MKFKHKMHKIFLSMFVALLSTSASAVSLTDALTSGYDNNEDLKSIRTNFLDEIEEFPQALSGFMPRIDAEFNSVNTRTKSRSQLPGARRRPSSNQPSFDKSITLTQPIFNGMSSVNALKAAQSAFRSSRAKYYDEEQKSFMKEIEVYLECVVGIEKYAITKISVRSNKTQLEAMTEKFKLGESTETEVAVAREAVATSEANQAVAYANLEIAKANFYKYFGIEPTDIRMPEVPSNLPKSLPELLRIASESNLAIEAAKHKTLSDKGDEDASKGKLLPNVSFKLRAGTADYYPEQPNIYTNNMSLTSTLSVNVPILSKGGAEYSDIRKAKYKTRLSAIGLDNIIKEIQARCKGNWSQYEAAKVRIDSNIQAVNAAEIAYEGMLQEEMLGSKTILDVLRAEEKLNHAREARVDARKELILTTYRIKTLTGDLTAKSMNLKVNYFEPEAEFKKVKTKIIGF